MSPHRLTTSLIPLGVLPPALLLALLLSPTSTVDATLYWGRRGTGVHAPAPSTSIPPASPRSHPRGPTHHLASATAHFRLRPEEEDEAKEGKETTREEGEGGSDCTYASFRAQIRREVEEESRLEEERELARARTSYAFHLAEERRRTGTGSESKEKGRRAGGEMGGVRAWVRKRSGPEGRRSSRKSVFMDRESRRAHSYGRSGQAAAASVASEEGVLERQGRELPSFPPSSSAPSPLDRSPGTEMAEGRVTEGGRKEGREVGDEAPANTTTAGAGAGARQSVIHLQVHKELHHQQEMLYVDCAINHR